MGRGGDSGRRFWPPASNAGGQIAEARQSPSSIRRGIEPAEIGSGNATMNHRP